MEVLKLQTWINEFSPEEINADEVKKYINFINQAVERYDPERYSEWHHIIPKCVDKSKKFTRQGVRINGKDHFIAHKLLVDCFSGPKRSKVSFALVRMSSQISDRTGEITPEEFEEVRLLNSQALKGHTRLRGKHWKLSEETRDRMKSHPGNFSGHHHSEESKLRMKESSTGYRHSEESKKKISLSHQGMTHSEESRKKMSCSKRRENLSKETRQKLSMSKIGNTACLGKICITNGKDNRKINKDEIIPEGWWRGITRRKVS